MEEINCKKCGKTISSEFPHCPYCGTKVVSNGKFCQNCGASMSSLANVCSQCGAVGGISKDYPIRREMPQQQIKNPGVAAVLSFFIVGLGQIYNGEIGKGIGLLIFWGIAIALSFILIGIPLLIIIVVYGIYDAYNTAKKINERGYE